VTFGSSANRLGPISDEVRIPSNPLDGIARGEHDAVPRVIGTYALVDPDGRPELEA
jgi:hypothetical protein